MRKKGKTNKIVNLHMRFHSLKKQYGKPEFLHNEMSPQDMVIEQRKSFDERQEVIQSHVLGEIERLKANQMTSPREQVVSSLQNERKLLLEEETEKAIERLLLGKETRNRCR